MTVPMSQVATPALSVLSLLNLRLPLQAYIVQQCHQLVKRPVKPHPQYPFPAPRDLDRQYQQVSHPLLGEHQVLDHYGPQGPRLDYLPHREWEYHNSALVRKEDLISPLHQDHFQQEISVHLQH
jgi:hypothetical protein